MPDHSSLSRIRTRLDGAVYEDLFRLVLGIVAEDTKKKGSDDDEPPAPTRTIEVVADKGYHKAELLHELKKDGYRPYIGVPKQEGERRWRERVATTPREPSTRTVIASRCRRARRCSVSAES